MNAPKILIVVTSHEKLGTTGQKTGFWLEELAVPYMELVRAGAGVDIASPLGGKPPADPKSETSQDADVRAFLADAEAMKKLSNTIELEKVTRAYDAVFVAGGHGMMWDLASSPVLAALLSKTYREGHVVAAVCHGPAALVNATKANGEPLVKGHRFTAFSNEEEAAVELDGIVPFLLESKLLELGGTYERTKMWAPHVVRDALLVTGQNPSSSRAAARAVVSALQRG